MKRTTLSDFETCGNESLVAALKAAREFCFAAKNAPDVGGYTLTFTGPSGVGKTFLSRCILGELGANQWGHLGAVKAVVRRDRLDSRDYQFRDWRRVSDRLKNGEWSVVDGTEEPFLLVLDDVGADYDPRGISVAKLDKLLRARRNRWTILTCNFSLAEIGANLDARIASWLIRDGNRVVNFQAQDFALRKGAAQ